MNLGDIAILNSKNTDYRCVISEISECEPINLVENVNLTEKKEQYNNIRTSYYI